MICEECKKAGIESTIRPEMTFSTLIGSSPYWDHKGVYHSHDLNISTTEYSCSNGHTWCEKYHSRYPGCNWPEEEKA
jgi:hypothetical protein